MIQDWCSQSRIVIGFICPADVFVAYKSKLGPTEIVKCKGHVAVSSIKFVVDKFHIGFFLFFNDLIALFIVYGFIFEFVLIHATVCVVYI